MRSPLRALMVLALLTSACTLALAQDEPNAPVQKKAQDKTDELVVTVNGNPITEAQVNERLDIELKPMAKMMAPNYLEQYKARLRPQMIDALVIETLLDAKLADAGITVSDQEVDKKINEFAAEQKITLEGLKKRFEEQGQDFNYRREQLRKSTAYQKFMEKEWEGSITVNEEDALNYYNTHKQEFSTPEKVHARHILIKVDPNAPEQEKTNARLRLEAIREEIQNGADFAQMAKTNSDGPSAKDGGDLGYFARGQMVKPFEDAAFAAEPGTMTGVIETQFGYHIIQVEDHSPASQTKYDEAKLDIFQMLLKQKQQQFAQNYIEKLKADADIVYAPGKEPKAPQPPAAASAGNAQTITVGAQPPDDQQKEQK